MKKILIVDIPTDYKWSVIDLKIVTEDDVVLREIYLNELKSMPQKKTIDIAKWNDYGSGWDIGYNACIDEILGEDSK